MNYPPPNCHVTSMTHAGKGRPETLYYDSNSGFPLIWSSLEKSTHIKPRHLVPVLNQHHRPARNWWSMKEQAVPVSALTVVKWLAVARSIYEWHQEGTRPNGAQPEVTARSRPEKPHKPYTTITTYPGQQLAHTSGVSGDSVSRVRSLPTKVSQLRFSTDVCMSKPGPNLGTSREKQYYVLSIPHRDYACHLAKISPCSQTKHLAG